MSAVPASPSRPDRCSSVAASSAGGMPDVLRSHSTRPGSTLPERVAITRPSSGVKPIVVSTERPSRPRPATRRRRGGRSRSAAPPAAGRAAPRRAATRRRATARGSRSGAAPSARATRAAARRSRRPAGSVGVERRVEAGDRGHVRAGRALDGVERGERLRLVQRRQVGERRAGRARPRRRRRTGARKRVPPWTTRWPTASTRPEPVERRARPPAGSAASARARQVARADERVVRRRGAQLEAARAGVDDEDPHRGRRSRLRPATIQSRTSGGSSPCSRVYARRSSRSSTISWRRWPARGGRGPGTRSMTSITRWKRSRSLSMTMSNGVVVVPSSL